MFKKFFESTGSSDIKKAQKLLKKGDVTFIDDRDILAYVTDYDDGIFYGIDQFDNDVEIDLNSKNNTWKIEEGTVAADVAQATPSMGMHRREMKCTGKKDCKCDKCKMNESPVGSVGRTGVRDAQAHVTPELRAEFKKIVRKLGGKTVARQLLAEMNGQVSEGMKGGLVSDIESMLLVLSNNCNTKKMQDAVDEVLDLMDTECK